MVERLEEMANAMLERLKQLQQYRRKQKQRKTNGQHNPLLRAVEKRMRTERLNETIFEPAEMTAKQTSNSKFGPQGGFASGRFHNYWG